jgi:hypothetical protein
MLLALPPESSLAGKQGAGASVQPGAVSTRPTPLFDERDLPGRYYFGDGLGVNCSLVLDAKNHRFTFKWHGCMGEYDSNLGRWEMDGDVLVLMPEKPNKREGFEGMNIRYVPVQWGQRHYLVDENEMPGFCAAAGQKDIPGFNGIHGSDYVKRDGEELPPVEGRPAIPERFREFYEKGPIKADVVRIEGKVVLNKGLTDRIKPGMLLAAEGHERIELKVLSVREHESVAEVSYFWNSDRRVAVGDSFTTGEYFNRPRGTGFERFADLPKRKKDR